MSGERTTLTVGSLCTGYGGLERGLTLAGWQVDLAWVADNDPAAARVLAHRHPGVPNLGDVAAVDWASTPAVDVLAAGFPCTDISCAGRQAGMGTGTRSGVWVHVVQAIAVLRPRLVVVENVAALLSTRANRSDDASDGEMEPGPAGMGDRTGRPVLRALGAVLGDLATLGFDAEWVSVPASGVGACHRRNRVFVLAWPADSPDVGLGHPWQEGGQRVPAAAVAGAVRPDGRVDLLPTPNAALGRGTGFPSEGTARERFDRGTRCLDDAVALLPTPASRDWKSGESNIMDRNARPLNEVVVNLLPTPRATDGANGGPNQRGSSGDLMPPSAVHLLPTPVAGDAERASLTYERGNPTLIGALLPTPTAVHAARNATANRTDPKLSTNTNGWTLSDVAHADRWGQYAPAIARWEQVIGRPAPDPTEPGTKGQRRLSPRFVEWMQGLPDGWVTAVPGIGRNDALRLLGNGVVPLQCAAAFRALVARMDGGDRP